MTDLTPELLMSKVVDGDATEREWQDFIARAEAEPALWREAVETHRDHAALACWRSISRVRAWARRLRVGRAVLDLGWWCHGSRCRKDQQDDCGG